MELRHDYDLNVTDVCPVGALTDSYRRSQQRVWNLSKTETVDPFDSLGANIAVEHNDGHAWRIMPRRNAEVNKSWISNRTRLEYQKLSKDRLTALACSRRPRCLSRRPWPARGNWSVPLARSPWWLRQPHPGRQRGPGRAGRQPGKEGRALWRILGQGRSSTASPSPAIRSGTVWDSSLLGIADNLDELVRRAKEFDVLLVVGHDLWALDAQKAKSLEAIPERIVLSAWHDASTAKATLSVGVRAWAEIRGTMINCQGRVQMLNAAPVLVQVPTSSRPGRSCHPSGSWAGPANWTPTRSPRPASPLSLASPIAASGRKAVSWKEVVA